MVIWRFYVVAEASVSSANFGGRLILAAEAGGAKSWWAELGGSQCIRKSMEGVRNFKILISGPPY